MTIGNQRLNSYGLKGPLCGGAILAAVAGCSSDGPTSVSTPPRDSLAVVPQELVLGLGMSRQLSATVLDQSGAPISGPAITFSSSNPDRVRVTPEGMATYVSAGPAEIKASGEDLLASVPYTGLPSGHPLGTLTTSTRLPGDHQGDAPFGVAVAGDGRIFISQTNTGRVAADFFPVTGFSTRDLGGTPTSIALLAGGVALVTPSGPDANDARIMAGKDSHGGG